MKKVIISIFIFLIILLLSISIIIANNTTSSNLNKEKIYYQIKYMDNQIIYMSNLLSDKNYSLDDYNNWNKLISNVEELYNYWNSTILDLNNLEIDKQYLTDFGKILDNLTVSINSHSEQAILNNLVELYKQLIIYSESLNYDVSYTYILYTKYNLLSAYSIVESGNWTLVHESILKSSNYLSNVVNSIENNKYSQYNINQAYISVKELENIINVKDLDVFYIKFRIAIEKLQNI